MAEDGRGSTMSGSRKEAPVKVDIEHHLLDSIIMTEQRDGCGMRKMGTRRAEKPVGFQKV